jgi:hypothetical protein
LIILLGTMPTNAIGEHPQCFFCNLFFVFK